MSILWPSSSLISFPFAYNNGVSLYIAGGARLIDRSEGRDLPNVYLPLLHSVDFSTDTELILHEERERERETLSLSSLSSSLPLLLSLSLSLSLLCTGDRVIEIETNERREVARYRRALCAEPRRTFRHPYGLFAGQLSIPSR